MTIPDDPAPADPDDLTPPDRERLQAFAGVDPAILVPAAEADAGAAFLQLREFYRPPLFLPRGGDEQHDRAALIDRLVVEYDPGGRPPVTEDVHPDLFRLMRLYVVTFGVRGAVDYYPPPGPLPSSELGFIGAVVHAAMSIAEHLGIDPDQEPSK